MSAQIGWQSVVLLVFSIIFQSLAAVLAKAAGLRTVGGGLSAVVVNPFYVLSLVALGMQSLSWLAVLRKLLVSTAYPFLSLAPGVVLALAAIVFADRPAAQWGRAGFLA